MCYHIKNLPLFWIIRISPLMKKYRTLNDGELVMAGDEFWGIDRIWIPATEIGKKVTSYTHKMYRRPLTETSSQTTDTCPDCSNEVCDCGIQTGYTPTPRTDEATLLATDLEQGGNFNAVHVQVAQRLEKELTAVTEQLKETQEALAAEIKHHTETTTKWNGHHMDLTITQCDLNTAHRTLKEVTEQRDRLAEALRKAISWGDSASHHILYRQNINWTYLNEAREALQSLNQPTQ